MSIESARAFLQKVAEDDKLRDKVFACENDDERKALVKAEGFDFTAEELNEVRLELSDDELDQVAGGTEGCGCQCYFAPYTG